MLQISSLECRNSSEGKMIDPMELAQKVVHSWDRDILAVRQMNTLEGRSLGELVDGLIRKIEHLHN